MIGFGFQPGDWVIYRKTKHSRLPGPRAENVIAAPHGDDYTYTVDKFWVVDTINRDGTLLLRTRRGKEHTVDAGDPNLRRANWWERWRYRDRFVSISPDDERSSRPSSAQQPAT